MLRILICLLLTCSLWAVDELIPKQAKSRVSGVFGYTVETGAPFSLSMQVPQADAKTAFRAYVAMLSIGRPLPWPYLLEGFTLEKNTAFLSGRVMASGAIDVPLGVFVWEDQAYELPVFHITAKAPELPRIRLSDLQPPFPDRILEPTLENRALQVNVSAPSQLKHLLLVKRQSSMKILFYVSFLLIASAPFAWHLWKRCRKSAPTVALPVLTSAMRLRAIQEAFLEGKTPWTELLLLLNCFGAEGGPPLTSFELAQQFAAAKRGALANAATLCDQYGYREGGQEKFADALKLVANGVAKS